MSDNKPFLEFRAVFEKQGAAVYFSHLDLNRTVSRALRRSKLDIWVSEGFTPRPHLVFSPPLSLGYKSEGEIMDFRLKLGAAMDKDAFRSAFPDTLKILDVYTPSTKIKDIAYADWTVEFDTDTDAKTVCALFSKPLVLVKKTKRSEKETDITQFIKRLECTKSGARVRMDMTLDCSQESSLSPAYILEGLEKSGVIPVKPSVTRKGFRFKDMTKFK